MARYLVVEEGKQEESSPSEAIDGLTVAKALARKRSRQSARTVVVRDAETSKVVARYAPQGDKERGDKEKGDKEKAQQDREKEQELKKG